MFEADDENNTPSVRRNSGESGIVQQRDPSLRGDADIPPLLRLMIDTCAGPDGPDVGQRGNGRISQSYSHAIMIGEAGASLATSRLLAWGFPTQQAMPGSPYDLSVDLADGGHARIQVKTTNRLKDRAYHWILKRGCSSSASGTFRYERGDFDIAALVALPIDRVLFRIAPIERASVKQASMLAPAIELTSWQTALRAFKNSGLVPGQQRPFVHGRPLR
ncbi:hypothetical protein AruPA_07485 [Acidiphilium sp. PA]|uniref:hypothetical protein n=1 Tax=Acidiphilium sp. PA TaxID=2871705 RepID=UPI002243A6B4|nr:hypothetical protein [Acidiphilium sp. PA]MCW8306876.1 hypothetical protein [Acidiphilium sp. PA]